VLPSLGAAAATSAEASLPSAAAAPPDFEHTALLLTSSLNDFLLPQAAIIPRMMIFCNLSGADV
jgi:hypothetical protein